MLYSILGRMSIIGTQAMPLSISILEEIRSNAYTDDILDLESRECTDDDVHILVEALKQNTYIKYLNLSRNLIGDTGAAELAGLSNIKKLDLSGNDITHLGAGPLSKSGLTHLKLNDNPLEDEGIKKFVDSQLLEELSASNCGIKDEGANVIFQSTSIEKLNLSNNEIRCLNIDNFSKNSVLESLFLGENPISESDGIRNLSLNNSLKVLDLSENNLTDDSAKIIASGFKNLQKLYLTGNEIGNLGSIALSQHENLENLVLLRNNVKNDGALALFKSKKLKELILISNQIDVGCLQEYFIYRQKMYINLDQNPISQEITHASFSKKLSVINEIGNAVQTDKKGKSLEVNFHSNTDNKATSEIDKISYHVTQLSEIIDTLKTTENTDDYSKEMFLELSQAGSKAAEIYKLIKINILISTIKMHMQKNDCTKASEVLSEIDTKLKSKSSLKDDFSTILGNLHFDVAVKWFSKDSRKMEEHLEKSYGYGNQQAGQAIERLKKMENPFFEKNLTNNSPKVSVR